jgi:hypothetical protein
VFINRLRNALAAPPSPTPLPQAEAGKVAE